MLRRLRDSCDDSGFSLVESVIALTIAAIAFSALAAGMISSLKAVVNGRQAQQASDVLQQSMEKLRALGYDSLAMRSTDLAVGDTLALSGCSCYNPLNDTTSGASTEPLALDPGGSVNPHVLLITENATVYKVREYVTKPTDTTGVAYKRITVVGTWSSRGQSHTRSLSSFLTLSRSGLPLPDYKFTLSTSAAACASPGANLVYGFSIKNNGARDSFSLTTTGGSALSWNFYQDDGTASVGTYGTDDTAEPNLSGVPTVGTIEVNTSAKFWAVASLPGGTTPGTYSTTFVAASVSDPAISQQLTTASTVALLCTATPTPTPTSTPTPTPTPTSIAPPQPATRCTTVLPAVSTSGSVTPTAYFLTNGATNTGNTVAASVLPLGKLTPPVSTTLWDYSTDLASNAAGRYLSILGTPIATTADWRYQFAPTTTLIGNGVLDLWVAPASGNGSDVMVLAVTVRQLSSSGTVLSTFTTTTYGSGAWGCAGPKNFGITVPFGSGSGTTFSPNDFIDVQVSAVGAAAELAYDTTTFTSALTLPVKSGG